MNHPRRIDVSADASSSVLERLNRLVALLPRDARQRARRQCDALDHWLHLRREALKAADELLADASLEIARLRFELSIAKRRSLDPPTH